MYRNVTLEPKMDQKQTLESWCIVVVTAAICHGRDYTNCAIHVSVFSITPKLHLEPEHWEEKWSAIFKCIC